MHRRNVVYQAAFNPQKFFERWILCALLCPVLVSAGAGAREGLGAIAAGQEHCGGAESSPAAGHEQHPGKADFDSSGVGNCLRLADGGSAGPAGAVERCRACDRCLLHISTTSHSVPAGEADENALFQAYSWRYGWAGWVRLQQDEKNARMGA